MDVMPYLKIQHQEKKKKKKKDKVGGRWAVGGGPQPTDPHMS